MECTLETEVNPLLPQAAFGHGVYRSNRKPTWTAGKAGSSWQSQEQLAKPGAAGEAGSRQTCWGVSVDSANLLL